MPKVEVFQVSGLDLWFNSSDHLPPHFHAENVDTWEVRVFFLRDRSEMVEKKWGRNPRQSQLTRLLRLVEQHRAALLEEWEAKVAAPMRGTPR